MDAIRRNWLIYVMVAPIVFYFCAFVFYPMAQGIYLSFQKAGLLGPVGFIGLENYRDVFATPSVWQAGINTLVLAAGITLASTFLPIIPAIALAEIVPQSLRRALQTAIYIPHLFSWVIIIGIWVNTLSPIGLVNSALLELGVIAQPITFFSSPDWARPLLIGQTVWKDMGYIALIYFTALLSLDPDIIEAADLDGANGFQKIRDHMLPHLVPMMKIVFLITLTGSLRTFDSSLLMLNGRTAEQIRTLAVLSYERGILRFDLGFASAAGVVLLVLTLIITGLVRLVMRDTRIG